MEPHPPDTPDTPRAVRPPAPGHGYDEEQEYLQRRSLPDMSHIHGWGADLDRAKRPAVPMERTPPRLDVQPAPMRRQPRDVEVLVSPERFDGITPVFGSTLPPRGLSGWLRRQAYKMTENDVRHFLVLMLADRVDMVEGLGEDLARGHVPNVLAEMGIRAEWRHNKAGLVRKAAVATAAAAAVYWLLRRRGR